MNGNRYILPPYNGFSHEERVATNPIQRDALRRGLLIRPDRCSICGFSDPSNPTGRGYLFLHLEDYRHPLICYGTCKKCHAALHARFRDPTRWQSILSNHYQQGRWYTLLTMDPATQTRAFDDTYPRGLPREWDVWGTNEAPH